MGQNGWGSFSSLVLPPEPIYTYHALEIGSGWQTPLPPPMASADPPLTLLGLGDRCQVTPHSLGPNSTCLTSALCMFPSTWGPAWATQLGVPRLTPRPKLRQWGLNQWGDWAGLHLSYGQSSLQLEAPVDAGIMA